MEIWLLDQPKAMVPAVAKQVPLEKPTTRPEAGRCFWAVYKELSGDGESVLALRQEGFFKEKRLRVAVTTLFASLSGNPQPVA